MMSREKLNQKRREHYDSEARKASYYKNREAILQKCKENTKPCPLCHNIHYHATYLREHMMNRHKLSVEEIGKLLETGRIQGVRT